MAPEFGELSGTGEVESDDNDAVWTVEGEHLTEAPELWEVSCVDWESD